MAKFRYEGHKLAYTIHGRGPRTTVLMPGLLLSQKMHKPLAEDLAALRAFIAADSPSAAKRAVRRIAEMVETLLPQKASARVK